MSQTFTPPMGAPALRGIVLREDSDTLVIRATPPDVRRFAEEHRGQQVDVARTRLSLRLRNLVASTGAEPQDEFSRVVTASTEVTRVATAATSDALGEPGVIRWRSARGQAYLYDEQGRPVAVVTSIEQMVESIDVTTFGSRASSFLPGRIDLRLEARGLPGVRVE